MSYPEPTVGAIIQREDGKILLARSPKWHGAWVCPGGHIEEGETIGNALKREVMEEVGIDVEVVRLLKVQDFIKEPSFWKSKHFIFLDFLCRHVSGEPKADGSELTECKWFTVEEAMGESTEAYTKNAIRALISELPAYDNEPREPK